MPRLPGTSSTIEDYLVTIYRLSVSGRPVRGTELAEQLGVSPAAVTEMVSRLRSGGLLGGARRIELSGEGLRLARTLVSRHRLAERFLVDVLGFGWEDVHEEAHRLEHAFSPQVTERLAAFLGHPETCPHGHPIMEDGGEEPPLALQPLTALRGGEAGVVRRIAHEDHDLLAQLSALGIVLGARVQVSNGGGDGAVDVELDGARRSIGRDAAAEVLVEAT
ncbi:MAG TPA: metal-dependent transcriptional regulator [Candidatus Angelobacter sp.]|jgi:DtxR family Mn-dependent transcriptional regulator|nr:metal-dependent transcriptional regulator [Candidatus Angelobacter sp.]